MKRNNQFWFLRFDDDYDRTKETFREYRNNRELYYDHNKKDVGTSCRIYE